MLACVAPSMQHYVLYSTHFQLIRLSFVTSIHTERVIIYITCTYCFAGLFTRTLLPNCSTTTPLKHIHSTKGRGFTTPAVLVYFPCSYPEQHVQVPYLINIIKMLVREARDSKFNSQSRQQFFSYNIKETLCTNWSCNISTKTRRA